MTCSIKDRAKHGAEGRAGIGMKCAKFKNLSTTTQMTVFPLEAGKSTIKSIQIWVQGARGTGNGCRRPWGTGILMASQTVQALTKAITSFFRVGHQTRDFRRKKVCLVPGCPDILCPWAHCKTSLSNYLGTCNVLDGTERLEGARD